MTPLSVSYCGHHSADTQQVQVQSWSHVGELKEDTVGFSESSVPSVSSICITRSVFHSSLPCPVEPWTTWMGSLTLLTSTYFWSMGNPWRWWEGKEENEVRVLPPLAPFGQGFSNLVSSLPRPSRLFPREFFPQSSLILQVPVSISSSSLSDPGLEALTLFLAPGYVATSCGFPVLFPSL